MLPGESMQQPMAIRPPQFPSDPAFSNPGYPSADFTSYQYATGLTAGPETMYPSPYGTPPASAFYPPASMVMPTTNRIQLGPAEQSHYMNLRTSAVERDRRGIDRILSRDASALAGEKKAAFDNEQEEDYIGSRRTTRDGMRHTAASPPLKPSARTTPQRKKKRQPKGASESEKEQSDSGPPSWPSFAEGSEMTPAFGPAK
eukprot:Polyplicarium_translucidae@DN2883_c0_g1_i2.p1